jgi:hypothetical protein
LLSTKRRERPRPGRSLSSLPAGRPRRKKEKTRVRKSINRGKKEARETEGNENGVEDI